MRIFIIIALFTLVGCKVKKESSKTDTLIKTQFKTEYIDTGSTKIEKIIEYQYFYDTITKKVYVFPKKETFTKSENKAIRATESTKSSVHIKTENKSVEKPKSGLYWKLIGMGVVILLIIWFYGKIKKFLPFLP